MKLTKSNMLKVIESNFPNLEMDTFRIKIFEGSEYNAKSKYEGVNASVWPNSDNWEDKIIAHIKWQLKL